MTISIKELETEREKLKKDFDDLKMNIGKVEVDLGAMKSNLNAVYGAIQQVDKLLAKLKDGTDKKPMSPEKEKALNLATS